MDRLKSVALLNKAVSDELQAVHQYMYFHFHLANQGFDPLAKLFKMTAIREMGHVELLAERILFLKGDVVMLSAGPVETIQDPEAILAKAMAMEDETSAALACGANADAASKMIFENLVGDEEGHYGQFETQRDNVKRFGLSYLALQSFGGGAAASAAAGN